MKIQIMADGSEKMRYPDPAIPLYIVHGDLRSLPDMAFLCHWHEDVELLMPLKGYLNYNVNGQQIRIEEGNAIFVNVRQMHYGYSADGTDCIYLCAAFRPELLYANREIQNRYILPVLTNTGLPYLLLERENPAHGGMLDALGRIPVGTGNELMALGRLYEFWQGLYVLAQDAENHETDESIQILKRMLEYIRTHYGEKVSLGQIAAAGCVCRSRCCRIFRAYLNCTPIDYLNSFRIDQSAGLLAETNLSMTEVAHECGFSGGSYFSEMFLRYKGCQPTEYRKRRRE